MFGLEDMKKIVYGGLVREKETGAFTFSRMTVKQYGYFTREEDARFLVRMGCTAGICMDFYTDSGSLEFDYEISGMSDRDIVQLDICQNGVRTGGPAQKPGKDTVGSIHHRIDRDGHRWNRITVWLPYMSSIALKNISLAPGASLCTLISREGSVKSFYATGIPSPRDMMPFIRPKAMLCAWPAILTGSCGMRA